MSYKHTGTESLCLAQRHDVCHTELELSPLAPFTFFPSFPRKRREKSKVDFLTWFPLKTSLVRWTFHTEESTEIKTEQAT